MKPTYICGVIGKNNDHGNRFVGPIYRKLIGPFGYWVSGKKSRQIVKDFNYNLEKYTSMFLYWNTGRINPFGIIAFSEDKNANFNISENKLETMVRMFEDDVAKMATGPDVPKTWDMNVNSSGAIIQSPRYAK